MKARIHSPLPQRLLLYGLSPEQTAAMTKLAEEFSMEIRPVGPEDLDRQVGALAGFSGFDGEWRETETPPLPEGACMVMAGLPSKAMDRLLAGMKQAGVSIPLKAVVTASNQTWSFARLMGELDRERAAISRRVFENKG